MRILSLTPYVPSLIGVRPYNLIKYLSRLGHLVTRLRITGVDAFLKSAFDYVGTAVSLILLLPFLLLIVLLVIGFAGAGPVPATGFRCGMPDL